MIRNTIALFSLSAALMAQQPGPQAPQAPKLYSSAADVAALIAKSKNDRKDGQATVTQRILQLAPYNASLEYRASVGPAAIHEKEAEMFYVIDGSGTLVTGGKLVGETRNGDNLTGMKNRPALPGAALLVNLQVSLKHIEDLRLRVAVKRNDDTRR